MLSRSLAMSLPLTPWFWARAQCKSTRARPIILSSWDKCNWWTECGQRWQATDHAEWASLLNWVSKIVVNERNYKLNLFQATTNHLQFRCTQTQMKHLTSPIEDFSWIIDSSFRAHKIHMNKSSMLACCVENKFLPLVLSLCVCVKKARAAANIP
jgi:hypothetical protein